MNIGINIIIKRIFEFRLSQLKYFELLSVFFGTIIYGEFIIKVYLITLDNKLKWYKTIRIFRKDFFKTD